MLTLSDLQWKSWSSERLKEHFGQRKTLAVNRFFAAPISGRCSSSDVASAQQLIP